MQEIITRLRIQLGEKLTPSRYEHSISVSYTAMALAMRYGYDLDKAELAGILHDCAKQYSNEAILKKCGKNGILLNEEEKMAPAVLHAKYGAWMAKEIYHVTDSDVLSSIRWHTTGHPQMTLLEEIVFTADYIEPRRFEAVNLPFVRTLAFTDLKECIYHILKDTLEYLNGNACYVDSTTNLAYECYRQLHAETKRKEQEQ